MIDVNWLATSGACKKYTSGQHIPCPGGPEPSERAMYILLKGRVDVYRASAAGGLKNVGSLLPGDIFGGYEFFADATGSTYTAGVESVVYVITASSFNDLSWSKPDILFDVVKAAYLPLRKMSASEKTAVAEAQAAASQKTAAAEETAKVAAKQEAAPQAQAEKVEPAAGQEAKAGSDQQASLPDDSGIYPEGHKSYPDITKPEYAKLVFPKEYTCPLCKKSFTDYRIFRSKLYESSPVRYDLRKFYTGFQTEWYDVIACHNCMFTTFHNYFTEPKPVQKVKFENELNAVKEKIKLDFDKERDIDFVFKLHYLAMLCAEGYLSVGRQIKAKLWGNLSWLYEDVGDEEMEKYSADKAATAYEEVYGQTHLTPVQEQITCLSIAGMQHRAGVDRNLKKFLFTAKTAKMGDRTYSKIADDFMFDLKVEE